MPTLYTQADKNIRRTYLLISIFLIFIIGLGWIFSYVLDSYLILVGAVLFSVLMSFSSYWYSDKIVLKMARAHPVSKESELELYRIVENLCITAGLPMPKIYIMDESAPNAFATGRDPEHAVIVFSRGLLEKLERSEIEGVAAHELSHIGNRDILLMTIVVVLVGFVTLLADWFLRWSWFGGSRRDSRDSGQIGIIIFAAAIILSILSPLIAKLIQLAISRKREFLADANGALLTRYPEGLASALEKISADSEPLKTANKAMAHLYITNPFKGKKIGFLTKMFMTHPPVGERIKALRGMAV
jgi:heat shock protein HtpX